MIEMFTRKTVFPIFFIRPFLLVKELFVEFKSENCFAPLLGWEGTPRWCA